MMRAFLILSILLFASIKSMAAIDVYEFESEEDRLRYQKFLEELRCPKCKNQNLAGTRSQIAEDLRRELHRMIESGQSDEEIIDYMVSRYGDFVLYRPRFQVTTVALWLAPLGFLLIGVTVISVIVLRRRRVKSGADDLSEDEQQRLQEMLKTHEQEK